MNQSATKNCEVIVENILQSERLSYPDSLRIGLIAYRDYPPQDSSYITKSFPFTSDVHQLKSDLGGLYASGGSSPFCLFPHALFVLADPPVPRSLSSLFGGYRRRWTRRSYSCFQSYTRSRVETKRFKNGRVDCRRSPAWNRRIWGWISERFSSQSLQK